MKTALITGANKGIGLATAKQLALNGYRVFLGSRDVSRGEEAIRNLRTAGLDAIQLIQLDVTDLQSVEDAKVTIEKATTSLDLLVNNAGVRGEVPQLASKVSMETLKQVFDTNFFGAIACTQVFFKLLEKSTCPKIINVTSDLASLSNQSDPEWKYYKFKPAAYVASKSALNAYTVMLAHELKDRHFIVNCVNPGQTATDFNGHKGNRTAEEAATLLMHYILTTSQATGNFYSDDGITPW